MSALLELSLTEAADAVARGDVSSTTLTQAALADYLISQSNAEAAIASGQTSAEELREQIIAETAGFFAPDETADAIFGVRVWTAVRQA